MKKALDYVSDYQLKSACKDAICIAPSKVTQMILAVLEDWYHHIVLTHSYKLVSFFTYIKLNSSRCSSCRMTTISLCCNFCMVIDDQRALVVSSLVTNKQEVNWAKPMHSCHALTKNMQIILHHLYVNLGIIFPLKTTSCILHGFKVVWPECNIPSIR